MGGHKGGGGPSGPSPSDIAYNNYISAKNDLLNIQSQYRQPLTYNASNRQWNFTPEPTVDAGRPTNLPTNLPTGHWESPWYDGENWHPVMIGYGEDIRPAMQCDGDGNCTYISVYIQSDQELANVDTNALNGKINGYNQDLNNIGNQINQKSNAKNGFYNSATNIINATKQGQYKYLDAKQAINNQKGILTGNGISDSEANSIVDALTGGAGQFRTFYLNERISPWDPSVLPSNLSNTIKGRPDLGSGFNKYADGRSGYYLDQTPQGRAARDAWNNAVNADNLDITARYGSLEAYAKQDYINQITDPTKNSAQIAAIRGSESRALSPLVTEYQEKAFPDAIAQQTRDEVQNKIFGIAPTSSGYAFTDVTKGLSDLISTNTTFNSLWTKAKGDISLAGLTTDTATPWSKLLTSLGVDRFMVTDQDSFGTLLGLVATLDPKNADDKQIIDANPDIYKQVSALKSNSTFNSLLSYTPEINDAFNASVQSSEAAATKKFGDLRQSILQDTINQLTQAKKQEINYDFFMNSSVGQEVTALQQDITGSLLGDVGVGGISPFVQNPQQLQSKLDLGLGNIFGTKNGLIYNWEDWFNNQIEKKYAGGIDIPNDYIPPALRNLQNGFVDTTTAASWKKYDDAYASLKVNPANAYAKSIVANVPTNYVPVENRKTIQPTWTQYETKLKAAGYVDQDTLNTWVKYDDAYNTLLKNPNDATAKSVYASRPADYIAPNQRMNTDVQFAKDFFSTYLKPRFDASQSIAEFQDYIDVTKNTQNPFQTQDRLDALKLAAQTSVSQWFTNLQKAGSSKFNSDYYFDPLNYLKNTGITDTATGNVFLPGTAFNNYADTAAGQALSAQAQKVNADWNAARSGQTSTDVNGNTIDWAQQAYTYGVDLNDKAAFAKLHYQLVGMNAPRPFDPAPDVYAPQISRLYITQVLTPMLIDKANKIGTVFGQFIQPKQYVEELLKAVNLPGNQDQWNNILKSYGIDPNASLSEISDTLINALSQDSTLEIKKKIGDLATQGKAPTQTQLGVEYIQRAAASGITTPASGVYAIFKNAGFNGTEDQFYSTFLPDASQEDISVLNAAYTTSGKAPQLFPTITGSGIEQIASMAALFGDTSIQEVLSTAGVATPTGQIGGLAQTLFTTSGEDVGIGDPFADTTYTLTSTGLLKTTTTDSKIGIGNPFDDIGISDPFSDTSDPFSSSTNPFSSIGSSSSISKPKISLSFSIGPKSSNSNFASDPFSSFGSSFGF